MDDVIQFFNRYASTYDLPGSIFIREQELTLPLCGPLKDRHVLEVGAGTGRNTTVLLTAGARVTALEPAVEMRRRLREKTQSPVQSGALIITDDSLTSYIPGQRFDLVLVAMVVDLLEDLEAVFATAAQALTEEGRLVISCVNPYYQFIVRKQLVSQGPGDTIRAHCHFFCDLLAAANRHGFVLKTMREAVIDSAIVADFPEMRNQLGYPFLYSALFQRESLTPTALNPKAHSRD